MLLPLCVPPAPPGRAGPGRPHLRPLPLVPLLLAPRLGHDSCAAREAIFCYCCVDYILSILKYYIRAGFGRLPRPLSVVGPRARVTPRCKRVLFFMVLVNPQVQDGTYVSSMVEDASFLVHKSLRRSVSTRSEQAIMAVCNRVTEVQVKSSLVGFG